MPIRIPDALPATDLLTRENVFVMTEYRAMHQDIRALRVVLLNLMPTKIATETQILRRLSNTPLQIEITLLRMASHNAKNVSEDHLAAFYRTFDEISAEHFDGMIITGAPVELLEFEEVDYWPELSRIMEWTCTNVHSTLHICWGAQAGIYFHYGIPKHTLSAKVSGIFEHRQIFSQLTAPLMRGFDDLFWAPHSRYTEVRAADIEAHPDLELLAVSDEAGVYIAKSVDDRNLFVFGHPEYDRATLNGEYERDVERGLNPAVPRHYYPDDDPSRAPSSNWRAHAQLLYTNWLNYYVYQTTPYDIRLAGKGAEALDASRTAALLPEGQPRALVNLGAGLQPLGESSVGQRPPVASPAGRQPSEEMAARLQSPVGLRAGQQDLVGSTYAEGEDDDGYDPWSDRREEPPLFEADPWK